MLFKLLGALTVISCGAVYSYYASRASAAELAENERVLELFRYVRAEISDYGTRLEDIFAEKGVVGGVDGLLDGMSGALRAEISEASRLGRGYGREELRICDKLIAKLEARQKRLSERLREVTAVSRVKGFGISAAVVILLI